MTLRKIYGKYTLLIIVAAGCSIMALLFYVYGYERTWKLWNIPTMSPYFADARGITAGAESHAQGYDALVNSPRDPWGRVLNYPRIWQQLSYFGVSQRDTIYMGITFAGLFFLGVFLYTGDVGQRGAWAMACCIFSPATLFALERGNNDLLIFFMLALSIRVVKKSSALTAALIACAFVLKLYPIFAVSIFLREQKLLFQRLFLSFFLLGCAYTAVMGKELRIIHANAYQIMSPYNSYGLDVAWMQLQLGHHFSWAALPLRIASYAMAILIAVFSALHAGRQIYSVDTKDTHVDAFRVGASVYLGTFALIGLDFDYKLIFLLFAVPQLLSWMRGSQRWIKRVATITMACVLVSLWSLLAGRLLSYVPLGGYVYAMIDIVAKGTAFSGLLYLLIYSCPRWIRDLCFHRGSPAEALLLDNE